MISLTTTILKAQQWRPGCTCGLGAETHNWRPVVAETHNGGLDATVDLVTLLAADSSLSLPDAKFLTVVTILEAFTGLQQKVYMKFGRRKNPCDSGHLRHATSKFDDPDLNIQVLTSALPFNATEMVSLYRAHTLGGMHSGILLYGVTGGTREAPFCENASHGGRPISQEIKDTMCGIMMYFVYPRTSAYLIHGRHDGWKI